MSEHTSVADYATALSEVRVVLLEPQDPVNIAAVVRAMKNMGLTDLRLVRPVEYDITRIELVAHDTRDVAGRIRHFESLDDALADCVDVAAFTARRRAAKRRIATPREMAPLLLGSAGRGPVALLFGREDSGLPNDALDRAHHVVGFGFVGAHIDHHRPARLRQRKRDGAADIAPSAGDDSDFAGQFVCAAHDVIYLRSGVRSMGPS